MQKPRDHRLQKPAGIGEYSPAVRRLWRRWMLVADWLGKHRPLDLACGILFLMAIAASAAQALS